MKRLIIFILCLTLVISLACDDSPSVQDVQREGGQHISDFAIGTNPFFEAWNFLICIDPASKMPQCK